MTALDLSLAVQAVVLQSCVGLGELLSRLYKVFSMEGQA